jgi:hypothetical protein
MVDPVTLILTALAAGAALGVQDTASTAVQDAYASLKALTKKRLTGRRDGEPALAMFERAPETWRSPLAAELVAAGASRDADLTEAAQALIKLVDPEGTREGKYTVRVRGGQGVQVGDHNTQHNSFGIPTSPRGVAQ